MVGLATHADWSTPKDRELAAEYPLFAYTLHLRGMMEAYRAEGDILVITKRMLDRAWVGVAGGTCVGCWRPLLIPAKEQDREQEQDGAVGVEDRGAGEPPSRGSFHPPSNVHSCGNWPPAQTRQNGS
ncbi:hypothetical protein BJV78DRAFT_1259592 [Lactifluus subvellereus]|nr:hypothetical protein BJV78DRAFT_1259592 [Lactifluus subvellereus]